MNDCRKTIGWADYTWNVINGCKTGCSYCCAKRMNDRFGWIPEWENPVFFRDRLTEPLKKKQPSKIFVVLMGDLFGNWISKEWIEEVLAIVEVASWHTFMFLTKNPKRYLDFDFPGNTMLGTTITNDNWESVFKIEIMQRLVLKGHKTFASIEPIHSAFHDVCFVNSFDLVIIGAETGRKPVIPERDWVESIHHHSIYYKDNILKYFPDLKNKSHVLQRSQTDTEQK